MVISFPQRLGEEEEGEGAVWEFGHPGGRVEGTQKEEEVRRRSSARRYFKDIRRTSHPDVTEITGNCDFCVQMFGQRLDTCNDVYMLVYL